MQHIEEISRILEFAFKENGIQDTPQNRITYLEGFRDGMLEQGSDDPAFTLCLQDIETEIQDWKAAIS